MSNDVKEIMGYCLAGIFAVIAVLIALWGFGWVWNQSVGSWLDGIGKAFNASQSQLSNEDIIRKTKQCQDAGLQADRLESGISGITVDIQCSPKDSKS